MPVKAGPKPDPEYLRVTELGLQMDADFRAADEPPPTEALPAAAAPAAAAPPETWQRLAGAGGAAGQGGGWGPVRAALDVVACLSATAAGAAPAEAAAGCAAHRPGGNGPQQAR